MLRSGDSSAVGKLRVLDIDPILPAEDNDSEEGPERPGFRDPDKVVDIETFDDVIEGSGSGISIESSTETPRRAVSAVQLFSFTNTGLDLCQHRLVTA